MDLGDQTGKGSVTGLAARALAVVALVASSFAALAQIPSQGRLPPAGPAPSEASVRFAINKYMQGRDNSFDNRKPFKILSGPTLATGETFAGNIEQAWLMCVVVNAIRTHPGPADIEGKSLYLRRNATGSVAVVQIENWKSSTPHCGGLK